MRTIQTLLVSVLLIFAFQSSSYAQSTNVSEVLKKHFNETVQQVQKTENADDKRAVLHESFQKMIHALDQIESSASLTADERAGVESYKLGLNEKLSELNGEDGFDEIIDEDLDDFSQYSQDFIEQANRTITIGATTAVLILIILLLL